MEKYYIDTKDVEKEWGIIFEKGTHNELLKFPERRDEYSQVWKDQSGTERYTDDVFFSSRSLNLSLVMIAKGEDDFTQKLQDFRDYIMKSGYFYFDCARLNIRLKLLYKNMQSYTKLTHLRNTGKVAAKFKLTLTDDFPSEVHPIPGVEYGGYGVEWDVNHADPLMTRIAQNMDDHKVENLPVHNAIKPCILKDDGTVNYYLDLTDKTLKEDGETASVLDGTDGQVMMEIPEHWMSFETDGDIRRVTTNLQSMPGAIRIPKRYVGAYEASVTGGKLESVSGVLAKSSTSRTGFRNYARARGDGWEMYTYNLHKDIFWLYMIEYANRNIQDTYKSSLDSNGYRQGGLGDGITTINSGDWNNYNGRHAMVPSGSCDSIGGGCGVNDYTVTDFKPGTDQVFGVPCFRGIENIYGHLWKWMDGINVRIQADNAGGESQVYVFDFAKDFKDGGYDGAKKVGATKRGSGYVRYLLFGRNGQILPKIATSGSSTTYWSDYYYTSKPDSGESLRGCSVGGHAYNGALAGVGCVRSTDVPSTSSTTIGSRLCFLPEGR